MSPALLLVLLVLAAYRGTRLVIKDTFPPVLWLRDRLAGGWRPLTLAEHEQYKLASAPQRAALRRSWSYDPEDGLHTLYVMRWSRSPHWLAELFTCPWCASAYVSGALVALTDITYGLPVPWLMGLAVWAGSALLASREWA